MPLNIYRERRRRAGLLVLALSLHAAAVAGQACPPDSGRTSGHASAAGWSAYRADSLAAARSLFERSRRLCAGNLDAASGLGYLALRRGDLARADSLFRFVTARDSLNGDGWDGLARTAQRRGDLALALMAARRAAAIAPANAEVRALLERLDPDGSRPPAAAFVRPDRLVVSARVRGERFETRDGGGWRPFYVKGVNLGVALPGRYPSEFPADCARYAGWLDTIAGMRANTVRVYTILPPAFYRALRGWNRAHPARPLWLMHGVWTELPPGNDFDDAAWKDEFRREMRRVADVVHGRATIPPGPGHAGGRYDADVSPWTLGYIIGREWEPYAVKAYDQASPGRPRIAAATWTCRAGTPMDAWMAAAVRLPARLRGATLQRAHARSHTPTGRRSIRSPIRPRPQPRRSGAWRREPEARCRQPRREPRGGCGRRWTRSLVRPTAANPAGWFASYHVYPYYPDFMNYDPAYLTARSSEGPSTYFGYLQRPQAAPRGHAAARRPSTACRQAGASRTSSRRAGITAATTRRAMAAIDARLTREIRESGAAGGILFAWMDEWFKRNWIVVNYEIPVDHTPRWHNAMDAEQHYGILAQYAGAAERHPSWAATPERWRGLQLIGSGGLRLRSARAGSNESYVYLAIAMPPPVWSDEGIEIGIDTWLSGRGQHRLPASGDVSGTGYEFAVVLAAPDTRGLLVAPDYNRYAPIADLASGDDFGHFYRRPVTVTDRRGRTIRQHVRGDQSLALRTRWHLLSRLGCRSRPAPVRNRLGQHAVGLVLRFGGRDARDQAAVDLLNVTDPSTRTLLMDQQADGPFGTVTADSFHFAVVRYRKRDRAVLDRIPPSAWTWRGWDVPVSHERLKPAADSMRAVWRTLP